MNPAGEPLDVLAAGLADAVGAERVEGLTRLTGGASRETWGFDAVDERGGRRALILRRDPAGRMREPGAMANEAAAMRACAAAGLRVPEVIVDAEAPSPWETAGIVMARVEGEALARRILRDDVFAIARGALVGDLAEFLAGLHAIDPDGIPGLDRSDPIRRARETLDAIGEVSATVELAFRWLAATPPPERDDVIVHGDLRLGNVLVGSEGMTAALDWELLHRGNPVEDLGWLCTKAWRFGAPLPVGGVGTREELLAAYRAAGGVDVDLDELRWWEVLNTLKWAVGCMGQASVHLQGAVRSVELAAIGRRVCEQEWDLLLLLCPDVAERHRSTAVTEAAGAVDLHGRPTNDELLEAVEEFLRDEVLPGTDGRLSFLARVAANAVATSRRELAAGPADAERRAKELAAFDVATEAELAARIAGGALDDRLEDVHEVLASGVARKLAVANPKYLKQ
jgi:aminoglycoside phosphotransferase (APT) family kinase protein